MSICGTLVVAMMYDGDRRGRLLAAADRHHALAMRPADRGGQAPSANGRPWQGIAKRCRSLGKGLLCKGGRPIVEAVPQTEGMPVARQDIAKCGRPSAWQGLGNGPCRGRSHTDRVVGRSTSARARFRWQTPRRMLTLFISYIIFRCHCALRSASSSTRFSPRASPPTP